MSLDIKKNDRILIVAPHPDDETIGCGGLMLKYGEQCEILLLTDGRKGYNSDIKTDEDALVETRANELSSAASLAGVKRLHMLGICDGTLKDHANQVVTFDLTPYDYIFVPNHYERHKDHAPVLKIIQKACHKQRSDAALYEYEVWSPIPDPTDILNLDELIERKLAMIHEYQSQIRYLDYETMTEALNRYRGVGQKMKYAEVYAFVPRMTLLKRIKKVFPRCLKLWIRESAGKWSTNNP